MVILCPCTGVQKLNGPVCRQKMMRAAGAEGSMGTPAAAAPARGMLDPFGVAPTDEVSVNAEAADVGLMVMEYLAALVAANVGDAATPNQKVLAWLQHLGHARRCAHGGMIAALPLHRFTAEGRGNTGCPESSCTCREGRSHQAQSSACMTCRSLLEHWSAWHRPAHILGRARRHGSASPGPCTPCSASCSYPGHLRPRRDPPSPLPSCCGSPWTLRCQQGMP